MLSALSINGLSCHPLILPETVKQCCELPGNIAANACDVMYIRNGVVMYVGMCVVQELVKDKGAVIFAYPKANTAGCTKQACGFRDNYADIDKAGTGLASAMTC